MRLLVLRFSAMGDVALLAPTLCAYSKAYSNLSVTLVTRKLFEPFFHNIPGVEVIGIAPEQDYRNIIGLYRLFRELKALGPYDYGIDAHGSLRSRVLKFFFRLTGLRWSTIDKRRAQKRALTRNRNKVRNVAPHAADGYATLFARAGLSAKSVPGPWINPDTHSRARAQEFLNANGLNKKENDWIGLAPFAKHQQKIWPLHHVREFLRLMETKLNCRIFLFGGGPSETATLAQLAAEFTNTTLVAGRLQLEGEIALMRRLDLMVAMDSANMHLSALLGVRVISIWGSTHPAAGFGPYGQDAQGVVQIDVSQLPCRPCSIYGNRPCFRKDLACLERITPVMVFERLLALK